MAERQCEAEMHTATTSRAAMELHQVAAGKHEATMAVQLQFWSAMMYQSRLESERSSTIVVESIVPRTV